MKVASIDLGSNTFLILVCEVDGGQITKIYRDEIRVTKLGQGVHANRKFHPDALLRAETCLKEFSQIIQEESPQKVLAMATSAARDVSNGQELFWLGEKYGIPIEIIPGHLEAQITFEGATFDFKNKGGIGVIDVGGGSTEVIALNDQNQPEGISVDVGSVRLTEMFVTEHPIKRSEVQALLSYAEEKFFEARAHLPKAQLNTIIGVAGTPTTLAAVMQNTPYEDSKVQGYKITSEQLEAWLYRLAEYDLCERKKLVGMDPQRADVIVAGTAILWSALRALGGHEINVSIRGVRYGIALHAAKT